MHAIVINKGKVCGSVYTIQLARCQLQVILIAIILYRAA